MRVLWFANIMNVILAPCFIFGLWIFPHLGVTGAAVGTTLGRGLGVLFASYKLFFGEKRFTIHAYHWKIDRARLWKLVKVSAPGVCSSLFKRPVGSVWFGNNGFGFRRSLDTRSVFVS